MLSPASGPQPPPPSAPKSKWREWGKARRALIDPVETGTSIARQLERSPLYAPARHVLAYLAFAGEPDLEELLSDRNRTFYTTRTEDPSTASDEPSLLTLHRLDPEGLERHRFGFLQPSPLAPPVASELIDLVLVPGLAFDTTGHRLGFGMGYYDRLLSTLDADVPRVGISPAALLVPRLPFEEHDVRMTHLATESAVIAVDG